MVKPRTLVEQSNVDFFLHDERLVMYFSTTKFDAVWREAKDGSVEQALPDLAKSKEECQTLREVMRRYLILDEGEDKMYNIEDPTQKQLWNVRRNLRKRLMEKPQTNFLIVYVLASHGIQSSGKQTILLNEFGPSVGFYKAWGVEGDIRSMAELYPNSYQIAFFSCGRELWNSVTHGGCIGGTKEKAIAHFAKKEAQRKANLTEEEARIEELEEKIAKAKDKLSKLRNAEKERLCKDDVQDENEKQLAHEKAGRGDTGLQQEFNRQNFAFVYGCPPGEKEADKDMFSNIKKTFLNSFDKDNLTLDFPEVFDSLRGKDSNFEMISSNTIQKLRLHYWHDPVKLDEQIAVVFITTELVGREGQPTLIYEDAMYRGEKLVEMFKKYLSVPKVELIVNASKQEIIKKFDELTEKAQYFYDNNPDSHNMAVYVGFIGFKLSWTNNAQQKMMKDRGVTNIKAINSPSRYSCYFPLTSTGEPVCFNEYCCRITANHYIQCVLIEDWLSSMEYLPNKPCYIAPDAEFQELNLDNRAGRFRLHYFDQCDALQAYGILQDLVEVQRKKIILLPEHLQRKVGKMAFTEIRDPHNMTIDMRTSGERYDDYHAISRYCFKHDLQVFKEKAELISCEIKKDYFWYSSVNYLPVQDVMVHIGGSEKSGSHIDVTLFTTKRPFKAIQTIPVDMGSYGYGLLAKDRRPEAEQDKDSILVAFVTERAAVDPCQIFKFTRVDGKWSDEPQKAKVWHPDRIKTQLQTFTILKDGIIMIAFGRLFQFLSPDLKVISNHKLDSLGKPGLDQISCIRFDHKENGNYSFFVGAYAKDAEIKKGVDYEHVYQGWSDKDEYSWLHRIEVSFEMPKLEAKDKLPEIKNSANSEKNEDTKEKESEQSSTQTGQAPTLPPIHPDRLFSQTFDVKPLHETWSDQYVKSLNLYMKSADYAHTRSINQGQLVELIELGRICNLNAPIESSKAGSTEKEQNVKKDDSNEPSADSQTQKDEKQEEKCQPKVTFPDSKSNSMYFVHEVIKGILEFAQDKLLVHVYPLDLVVFNDWKAIHRITDISPGNITKNSLLPLPNFHPEEFPFVVSSGYETCSLINVKTGYLQKWTNVQGWFCQSQEGGCFIQTESGDIQFHYANKHINQENKAYERYFCFTIKSDMIGLMKKAGRLPQISYYDYRNEIEENAMLSEQITTLKKEIEKGLEITDLSVATTDIRMEATKTSGQIQKRELDLKRNEQTLTRMRKEEEKATKLRENLQKQLRDATLKLKQSSGFKEMVGKISQQKVVTHRVLERVKELEKQIEDYEANQSHYQDLSGLRNQSALSAGKNEDSILVEKKEDSQEIKDPCKDANVDQQNLLFGQSVKAMPFEEQWSEEEVNRLNQLMESSVYEHKKSLQQAQLFELLEFDRILVKSASKQNEPELQEQKQEEVISPQKAAYNAIIQKLNFDHDKLTKMPRQKEYLKEVFCPKFCEMKYRLVPKKRVTAEGAKICGHSFIHCQQCKKIIKIDYGYYTCEKDCDYDLCIRCVEGQARETMNKDLELDATSRPQAYDKTTINTYGNDVKFEQQIRGPLGQKLVISFWKRPNVEFVKGTEITCQCCLATMPVSERFGFWSYSNQHFKLFGKTIYWKNLKPVHQEWPDKHLEMLNKHFLEDSDIVHKQSAKLNQGQLVELLKMNHLYRPREEDLDFAYCFRCCTSSEGNLLTIRKGVPSHCSYSSITCDKCGEWYGKEILDKEYYLGNDDDDYHVCYKCAAPIIKLSTQV